MPTVAVFGGSGHTGRRVIQRLPARGDEVRALARRPDRVQTRGTTLIAEAMRAYRVRRLVSLSGGGLPDALDHHAVLVDSDLDWTIVRGPRLTEGSPRGDYRVGWVGVNASTQIDRDDLADFIVSQIAHTSFPCQLPFVSR